MFFPEVISLIVYEATKDEFIHDVFMDRVVDKIHKQYTEKIGRVNKSELRSWENSLLYMSRVLNDKEIPDNAGVAIEFRIPYTSKRVDFLISGREEKKNSVIIVELKQWILWKRLKVKKPLSKHSLTKDCMNSPTHPIKPGRMPC